MTAPPRGAMLEPVNIFDPRAWADAAGWWQLVAAAVGTLVLAAAKLAGPRWDDWLDERVGRGSVRDEWPSRSTPVRDRATTTARRGR